MRQYQTELTKELQALQELKATRLEEETKNLKELVSVRDQEIADLRRQLKKATKKISVLTEQDQKAVAPTKALSSSVASSLATLGHR